MTAQSLKKAAEAANTPVKAPSAGRTVFDLLDQSRDQIARALPKHMDADRMARVAMTEFRKTPALLDCDPRSLLGAVIQAAQLGLEPGSALGHCYLLPFKNKRANTVEVQFIVGYRGMIDLARRSGQIDSINAFAVHEGDSFEACFGLDPNIDHVPNWDIDRSKPDTIRFVYAVAALKDGGRQFQVMSRAQIDSIRGRSKAGQSGPWVTDYEAMALKTVIRRLFKYLPVSVEMATVASLDEAVDKGESQVFDDFIDATAEGVF